jgi:hypothetical protein
MILKHPHTKIIQVDSKESNQMIQLQIGTLSIYLIEKLPLIITIMKTISIDLRHII